MIRVTFYFATGREQSCHDCDSIESAYERLARTGMLAHAYPVGSPSGLYIWRPDVNNDALTFKARMIELGASV